MPEPITLAAMGGGLGALAYYSRRYFLITKEVLDILIAFVMLVLMSPVMIFCALLIKLSSKGPVFYSQVRVGQGGRLFRMIKFRTMYVDAEKDSGAVWAQKGDYRVVPTCRWMRISHMDEVPQLLHVLTGVMSFVGPRPERPQILDDLEKHYPDIRRRLAVKPGITGLAQVRNGYDTSVEGFGRKLEADLEYIENLRWSQELSIIARTVTKLFDTKAC